jgi:sigma-B regulation protein RsbU (phosphoserine phosphatase)
VRAVQEFCARLLQLPLSAVGTGRNTLPKATLLVSGRTRAPYFDFSSGKIMEVPSYYTFSSLSVKRMFAAIAAILAVMCMAIFDLAGLLFHDSDPSLPSFGRLFLAAVFGMGVAVAMRPSQERIAFLEPYQRFMQTARFIALATLGLLAGQFMITIPMFSFLHVIISYFVTAITAILVMREVLLLDVLIRIRRTAHTEKVRSVFVAGIVIIVLSQWLFGVVSDTTTIVVAITTVALSLFFFFAFSNSTWIIALSRSQKWKVFGMCTLVSVLNLTLMVSLFNDDEIRQSLWLFMPGIEHWLLVALIFANIYFSRIALSLLLTLPSATIIDRQVSEKNSLSLMSRIMTSIDNIDELLAQVVGVVHTVTGATSVWIEIDSGEKATSVFNITPAQRTALDRYGVFAAVAAHARQPVYIESIAEHAQLRQLYNDVSPFLKSLIIVPIELDGFRIGTLFVAHSDAFALDHEQLAVLSAIAGNTSLAIQNYRLFANLLHKERYEQELYLAREIQQKLLPRNYKIPEGFDVAGYTSPALEVGGDYYDFVTLANGHFCAIIADVSGKGMSAAMYTAELKGIVLAVASESTSPADLLCRINKAIYGSIDRQLFITMAAVEIGVDTLRFARAGHNPFLMRADGKATFLQPRGIGIGLASSVLFDKSLEMGEVNIAPGDVCVLYTDGINEAMNDDREEYGTERLRFLIENTAKNNTAEFILGEVIRDVAEYAGSASQQDDMTLLAICRNREGSGVSTYYTQRHYEETEIEIV